MAKRTTTAENANAFTIEIINSDYNIHHVIKGLKQIDRFYSKEVQFWNSFNVGPQPPISAVVKDLNNRYQEFSKWYATAASLSDDSRMKEWKEFYKRKLESPQTLEKVAYPHAQGYGNKTEFLPIFFSDSLEAIALKQYYASDGDVNRLYWFLVGVDLGRIDKYTMDIVDYARNAGLLRTPENDTLYNANVSSLSEVRNNLRDEIAVCQEEKEQLFSQLRQEIDELKTKLLNEDKQRKDNYEAILSALEEKLRVEAPIVAVLSKTGQVLPWPCDRPIT